MQEASLFRGPCEPANANAVFSEQLLFFAETRRNVRTRQTLNPMERMNRHCRCPEADDLAELVGRAQQLDEEALERIVELYSPRLYGFAYRLTGKRLEAEDLVQDVFVRLIGTISKYVHDGRFDAWLFRIAVNLVRDRLRQLRRNPLQRLGLAAVSQDDDGDEPGAEAIRKPEEKDPERRMEVVEELDRLQQALARLPQPEREVVMLRHYGDLSFAEIARLMETPLGTALARAHRGLVKLREWMESPS